MAQATAWKPHASAWNAHATPCTGWQLLAMDTRPIYVDTNPFPIPSANWKHLAIYTKDSQRFGQWSTVVEIKVGG